MNGERLEVTDENFGELLIEGLTEAVGKVNEEKAIDLEKILTEAMLEESQSFPRMGKIYASDLGVALGPDHAGCARALWEKLHDAPQKRPSPGELLRFRIGDLIHDYIANLLRKELPKHGWEVIGVENNVRLNGVRGRYDIKIRNRETGEVRIIDCKTKRGSAFGFLKEPKKADQLQVQYYTQDGADGGDLLYIDREGQNFVRHFEVAKDDARPKEAARRLQVLRDATPPITLRPKLRRVENKGPDSLYLEAPWQVSWCNLAHCPCAEAIGELPDGIVGKVFDGGELKIVEGLDRWASVVFTLFREQYPDEFIFYDCGTIPAPKRTRKGQVAATEEFTATTGD